MDKKNLATNIMFLLDAILDDDTREPHHATLDAALALAKHAWNGDIPRYLD